MANGDVIETDSYYRLQKMIDAKAAVDVGFWIDTHGYDQSSIHVDGITTATVIINSSNAAVKPANSSHEIQRASYTADVERTDQVMPRWIKARISAWTSGTITVIIKLMRTGGRP